MSYNPSYSGTLGVIVANASNSLVQQWWNWKRWYPVIFQIIEACCE